MGRGLGCFLAGAALLVACSPGKTVDPNVRSPVAPEATTGAGPSKGRQIFVATTGKDRGRGTREAPFATLAHAARGARPGDVIYVRGGAYRGFSTEGGGGTSGTAEQPITLARFEQETVVIYAPRSAPACIELWDNGWVLEGLILSGGDWGLRVDGRERGGRGNLIRHCIVTNGWNGGISIGYGAHGNRVVGCVVHDNCMIHWPRTNSASWGGGISVNNHSRSNRIENCTVFHNHGEGIVVDLRCDGSVLRHNISADNWNQNIYVMGAQNVVVDGNLSYCTEDAARFHQPIREGDRPNCFTFAIENNERAGPQLTGLVVINNIAVNSFNGMRSWMQAQRGFVFGYTNWLVANNTLVLNFPFGNGLVFPCRDGTWDFSMHNNVIVRANSGSVVTMPNPRGRHHFSHNLYGCATGGVYQVWHWGRIETNSFAGWSALSGEHHSAHASNAVQTIIPGFAQVPPRLWNYPGLPVAPTNYDRVQLAAPFRLNPDVAANFPGTNLGARFTTDFTGAARTNWTPGAF